MWIYCEIDNFYVNIDYMEMAFVEGDKDLYILYVESSDKLYRVKEFTNEKEAIKSMNELFIPMCPRAISEESSHNPSGTCLDGPRRMRKLPKKGRPIGKKLPSN